ncbi:MAG: protein translocase subunit SecD [Candidatus Colwellbacteria bacterium]|nr:protein translocase subunit SecD [Candidatus Colwellbacteria bacterium]
MKNHRQNILLLIFIFSVAVLAALFVVPTDFGKSFLPWRLGLDLAGGTALVYEIDLSEVRPEDQENAVAGLRDVIEKRVNLFGVAEPKVAILKKADTYELLVELAGISELKDAVALIGETPVLQFAEFTGAAEDVTDLRPTELTGRHISGASMGFDQLNRPLVNFSLNKEGGELFENITERNAGKPLCILVDGNFIFPEDPFASCPNVNEKITGGRAQISGGSITVQSARALIERFQAGALAAPIELVNQRTISPSLATGALSKMLFAGAIGAIAVLLFMPIFYGSFGVIASIALIAYTVFTLTVLKVIPGFTMTLAGIAGFILSIGMAVDANILIFERTKEEIKKGLSKASAITEGFKRAWPSIRDSNITTILSAAILYVFTTSFVKGFALTLGVGVLVSMFSAIIISRLMLRVFIK